MCLLIYKNANVTIPEEHLEEGFACNRDGAGFTVRMVNDDGTSYLHRERGFFKYQDFIEAYRPFAMEQGIVHFRLATAGKHDEANCHPFEVTPDLHMGHNGIISIAQSISKDYSDTWHFVEQVIKPIYHRDTEPLWDCPAMRFLLGSSIGNSKLAFLHADGRHLIINEDRGHWDDEEAPQIWYSNDSYTPRRYCGFSTVSSSRSWGASKWDEEDELDSSLTKKGAKLLERARTRLVDDEWLVDEALRMGYTPSEILGLADDADKFYEELYNMTGPATEYRTWGSSID